MMGAFPEQQAWDEGVEEFGCILGMSSTFGLYLKHKVMLDMNLHTSMMRHRRGRVLKLPP